VETPLKRHSKTERPRVRNKNKARVLTREETAKLIAKTPNPYRVLIATTAVTGARQSEVSWPDVGVHRLRGPERSGLGISSLARRGMTRLASSRSRLAETGGTSR
jgi:hypothetical protein